MVSLRRCPARLSRKGVLKIGQLCNAVVGCANASHFFYVEKLWIFVSAQMSTLLFAGNPECTFQILTIRLETWNVLWMARTCTLTICVQSKLRNVLEYFTWMPSHQISIADLVDSYGDLDFAKLSRKINGKFPLCPFFQRKKRSELATVAFEQSQDGPI